MTRISTLLGLAVVGCLGISSAPAFAQLGPLKSAQLQIESPLGAAQRDFAQFVKQQREIHPGAAPSGFPLDVANVQDLKNARVAYGFPEYTIAPSDLIDGRREMKAAATPTGSWRFVLTLNGKAIGLATLEQVNGKWETIGYGAAVLSKDLDATVGAHANAQRSNVRLLRIYQAQSDLLEVSSADGSVRFAPLYAARQSLQLQSQGLGKGLLEASDLLDPLRAAIKKNMGGAR